MFRPIFAAPITRNVFVAPSFERLMPPIDGKLTDEHETSGDYLVSSLHSLFAHFNVKEDIYSLGKHSEYIADKLQNLQAAVDRRKVRTICSFPNEFLQKSKQTRNYSLQSCNSFRNSC